MLSKKLPITIYFYQDSSNNNGVTSVSNKTNFYETPYIRDKLQSYNN